MELKLFRLTKQFIPEWGKSETKQESFYISNDIEKIKTFINGQFNIELDNNGKACRYYRHEEGGDYYTLEELEATSLL